MYCQEQKIKKLLAIILAVFGLAVVGIGYVLAANNGNSFGYAWSEGFGWIRFDGTDSSQTYGVTVPLTDGGLLTGYAWGESAGWIHLSGSCDEAGGCPGGGNTYGVVATQTGCSVGWACLSGYAWGEGVGWIRFAATASTYANDSISTYGVYIDANGIFQGYAWGEDAGWIHLSGSCDEAGGCPDGANTYKVYFNIPSTSGFSIGMWVKPTTAIATKAIAVKNNEIRLVTDANGKPVCQIHNGTSWQIAATSTAALALNSWQYVSCTFDRSSIKVYINGILTATQAPPEVDIQNTTSTMDLGHDAGSTYADFQGYLDEFKYYKYARTAVQIKSDYTGVATKRGATVRSVTVGEQQDASEGLVGYWKMDEASWATTSATVLDSSGNGNNGTPFNHAQSTSTAKFGMAGSFDGVDDKVDISGFNLDKGTSYLTVCAWVSTLSDDADGIIGRGQIRTFSLSKTSSADAVKFVVSGDGGVTSASIIGTTSIKDGSWYHICAVYNSTSDLKLYVNGKSEGVITGDEPTSLWTGTTVYTNAIGYSLAYSSAQYFPGQIDDVKIYNKARTAEQIRRDYESGPPPVAHWKMDENTGTSAFDTSGNSNTGTLGGGTAAARPTWVSGKYGSALKFDGGNDYVDAGNKTYYNLANTNHTIGVWFNTSNNSATNYMLWRFAGGAPGAGYIMAVDTTGYVIWGERADGGEHLGLTFGSGYNNGKWHYAAATVDITTKIGYLYIDGVYKGSDTYSGNLIDNNANLYIGGTNSSYHYAGSLDDVRIYNYARTPKQILEDMNAGHPAIGSPVGSYVGYWPLDEMQGTTAYDKSINQNNLTLSTASWATSTSCKFNGCYQGAANTRITKADDADFDFAATDDFSVSTWFKRSAISSQEYLVYKENGFEGYAVYLDASGDVIFGIGDTSSGSFPEESIGNIGRDYDDGNWHNAIAVKTSNSRIDLYVDGVLIASDTSLTTDATLENSGKLILGDSEETADNDGFLGNIDDTKIYRFALSPLEIKEEYNRGASLKLGAISTASDGVTPSNSQDRSFCVPGDTSTCNPPVGWWKMDEKTGQYSNDTSGNGNTGTLGSSAANTTGDPTWKSSASCHTGSCLKFDGTDDYVDAGNGASLSYKESQDYTYFAWFKVNSLLSVSSPNIISDEDNLAESGWELYIAEGSDFYVEFWVNGGSGVIDSPQLNFKEWYNITITLDNVGVQTDCKMYLNGKFVGNDTCYPTDSAGNFLMGVYQADGDYLNGFIDDVRVYNYARTPAQIAWDYNRGAPIAHWQMNDGQDTATTCDGTGTTVKDSSGNGNTGTLTNSASPAASWIDGKYGCAIDFDGDNDVVTVTQNSTINLTSKTGYAISAWVYPHSDGQGDNGEIVQKGTATYLKVAGESGGRVNVMGSIDLTTTGDATLTLTSAIPINTWSHIVMTYDDDADDEISIYINGILKGTSTNGNGSPVTETTDLSIGGSASYNFDGLIDDVRIYNYSPTAAQVKTVFNEGSAVRFGPTEGLP